MNAASKTPPPRAIKQLSTRFFGIGDAGALVLRRLGELGLGDMNTVLVDTDGRSLDSADEAVKIHLETKLLRGLGSGGDPERGRVLAEEKFESFKGHCKGLDLAFIVAGLGGGAGSGITPVVARAAKESGALTIGFVLLPFECEGSRRCQQAEAALETLRDSVDALVCLDNQEVFKLIDENTSVLETFARTNNLLAEAILGFWRLLMHKGLIDIHFADICAVLRDRHSDSVFAIAEAAGATRSREVTDRILAHPLLKGGRALEDAGVVMVSLLGGPDLTMAEVNRVVQELSERCVGTQVMLGAAIEESFRDRLSITVIASRKGRTERPVVAREELDQQLLPRGETRTESRFVPPPPALDAAQIKRLAANPGNGRVRTKPISKMHQGQLPLEIVSKGRFDKSEPTIHKGEDLDVPTYLRRGVSLN